MRFLGIDYGSKRVGIAISDEDGRIAFPYKILKNDQELLDAVQNICGEQNIKALVLGESLNSFGQENKIMEEIKEFKKNLMSFGLPIHFQKEFLTSVLARDSKGKERYNSRKISTIKENKKVDAQAATLILQRFLDKLNKQL